ncbi:hypothetical protein FOA52_006665 [Chlamydomonas sp. UWO 241]|nr:hypothetical protein FOA52_006665 [Chlamydomonas sp. UWO 241]
MPNQELNDWHCVSQHYITNLIVQSCSPTGTLVSFAPTLLIAAHDHALSVANTLAGVLASRTSTTAPVVLTPDLQLYDAERNPYNPHPEAWINGTLCGQHILVVDVVDNTRATLATFIEGLQVRIDAEKAAKQGSGAAWDAPQIGVFVLHNKRKPKASDLPEEVMNGRYFSGEDVDNVAISYPFKPNATIAVQPTAHGDHTHDFHGRPRKSFEETAHVHRSATPPMREDQRILSTHYVDEVVEKAVTQQQLLASFQPQLLIAATDDSVAPARILRHHLSMHGCETKVLTSTLDLYDEDANPYNPVMPAGALSQLSGKRVLVVEKVDNTRAALQSFLVSLKVTIDAQRAAAGASGAPWTEPVLGVFVLNQKDCPKPDLPADMVSAAHYFAAETSAANVHVCFPFNLDYRTGSAPVPH